jgi:hypothetical protein
VEIPSNHFKSKHECLSTTPHQHFRNLPDRSPGYLYRLEKFREKRRIEEDGRRTG